MVASSSVSLKVSQLTLESDSLLSLILSLTPRFQISIDIETGKKSKDGILLSVQNKNVSSRNAVLRSLCGMTFHNALDRIYLLLGGCATAAYQGIEESVFVLGAITSWMSVSSTIQSSNQDDIANLLEYLDTLLIEQSFLVDSPAVTLADLDMFFVLSKTVDISGKRNVSRWFRTVHASAVSLLKEGASNRPDISKFSALDPLPVENYDAPILFYGGEPDLGTPTQDNSSMKTSVEPREENKSSHSGLTDIEKKAAAEKRAKKNAEKAAKKKDKKKNETTNTAVEFDISALEIKIGKITKIWNHETADKLFCEEVDIGESTGPRKIASGLRPFYSLKDLQDSMVLVLCNLKSRKLVGFDSHGMILCASNDDHTKVELMTPPPMTSIGETVEFEGYPNEPQKASAVAKKKIFEKVSPFLMTDDSGGLVWKSVKGCTSKGQCTSVNGMANAHVA